MSKLVRPDPEYWPGEDLGYWCPGCDRMHTITTKAPNSSGARWGWDGNITAPTFSPSIHEKINTPDMGARYQPDIGSHVCHHFVRAGKMEFLGDCTHDMRGMTVELPDFPAGQHLSSARLA